MYRASAPDRGFTLVELMSVVLILGVLVSIAMPVYMRATRSAAAKSCQANQRTIAGVIEFAIGNGADVSSASAGVFVTGGSGWHAVLVPDWVRANPTCPTDRAPYLLTADGAVIGDQGLTEGFKLGHSLH